MSHHRSRFKVATDQAGCSAAPVLIRFFHSMSHESFARRDMRLVRFEAVHVDFTEDRAGAQGRVVAAGADVNFSIRHGRNCEFYGVARNISGNLGAVPEFGS